MGDVPEFPPLLRAYAKDFYTRFVDLEKSYDRVPREKLLGLLRECGVDIRLLLAVESLCS